MKKLLYIIALLVLLSGCKTFKKIQQVDSNTSSAITEQVITQDSSSQMEKSEEVKGISETITETQEDLSDVEITKYEPVYYVEDGKEKVELKPVTFKKVKFSKKIEEVAKIDTTATKEESILEDSSSSNTNNQSSDSSDTVINNQKEYEGFDIIKSIIGGVVNVITGPFQWILWVVAFLLIIPLFRFIKSKLSKPKN